LQMAEREELDVAARQLAETMDANE